jgi:hypothetical protein
MPLPIKRFLRILCNLPRDDGIVKFADSDAALQHWGFTIYRTYYGPGSKERWDELLQKITIDVKLDLESQHGAEDVISTAKALSFFRLDARSDSTILEGLTIEQARQLYVQGTGGQPMNAANEMYRVLLLADEEVLMGSDYDSGLVKAVAAEYDTGASVALNCTYGQQHYSGWMRMSVQYVFELWLHLEYYFFEELVASTARGHRASWDPSKWS